MARENRGGSSSERHLDVQALRFSLVFPGLLALGLVFGGLMLATKLPDGVVLPLGGNPVPVPLFLGVGVASIILVGASLGSQGARTTLPRMLRRIVLGLAVTLQLSVFTLFVAALLGQGARGQLTPERVDDYVLLMGCGLALAMGVVLALTFKPDEQWTSADDGAFAALLSAEADPQAAQDKLAYFLHPRSSVVIMILLAAIMPGAFLALISPWILLALVVAALVVIAMLCATVEVDRERLIVKILGVIPVLVAPCEGVAAAVSLDIVAGDYGGWGLRKHSGSATFLARSGAAVVLRANDGGKVVVGAPSLDVADELSEILNRRAGKTPQQR